MEVCSICGKTIEPRLYDPKEYLTKKMKKEKICFQDAFWIEKCELYNKDIFIAKCGDKLIRYQGGIYNKREEGINGFRFRGCGGAIFYVKYFEKEDLDGVVRTPSAKIYNDVWVQGEIPKYLQGREGFEKLNENAKVITDKEYLEWLKIWLKDNQVKNKDIILGYSKSGDVGIFLYSKLKQLFYYFDSENKRFDEKLYFQIICPFKVSSIQQEGIAGIGFDEQNKHILESEYTEEEKKRLFNPYRGSLL